MLDIWLILKAPVAKTEETEKERNFALQDEVDMFVSVVVNYILTSCLEAAFGVPYSGEFLWVQIFIVWLQSLQQKCS